MIFLTALLVLITKGKLSFDSRNDYPVGFMILSAAEVCFELAIIAVKF